MLKRNLSVEAGLVNGSVGSVTGFRTQHSSNGNATQIQSVYVQFKNVETPVQIERQSCTFEVLKCIFYTRKQFPLMLAFAITVHKSQGLSLSAAIVDAGPSCFGSGMSYVALSRVTSVTGLHLIDFDKSKIICNKTAVTEYNRLRSLYAPHLGPLMLRWSKNGTEASENTTEGRSCNNSKAGGQEVNQNAPKNENVTRPVKISHTNHLTESVSCYIRKIQLSTQEQKPELLSNQLQSTKPQTLSCHTVDHFPDEGRYLTAVVSPH